MVTVTRYPVERPLSSVEDKPALQPSGGRATPTDPFSPESMEKGLSCLSLEVMTSGEHLNSLSLEDLSLHESGGDSMPECASSEGEGEGEELVAADEREEEYRKGEVEERVPVVEVVEVEERDTCPKDVTAIAIVEGQPLQQLTIRTLPQGVVISAMWCRQSTHYDLIKGLFPPIALYDLLTPILIP